MPNDSPSSKSAPNPLRIPKLQHLKIIKTNPKLRQQDLIKNINEPFVKISNQQNVIRVISGEY